MTEGADKQSQDLTLSLDDVDRLAKHVRKLIAKGGDLELHAFEFYINDGGRIAAFSVGLGQDEVTKEKLDILKKAKSKVLSSIHEIRNVVSQSVDLTSSEWNNSALGGGLFKLLANLARKEGYRIDEFLKTGGKSGMPNLVTFMMVSDEFVKLWSQIAKRP